MNHIDDSKQIMQSASVKLSVYVTNQHLTFATCGAGFTYNLGAGGVRVAQSLVLYVMLRVLLFVFSSFSFFVMALLDSFRNMSSNGHLVSFASLFAPLDRR